VSERKRERMRKGREEKPSSLRIQDGEQSYGVEATAGRKVEWLRLAFGCCGKGEIAEEVRGRS